MIHNHFVLVGTTPWNGTDVTERLHAESLGSSLPLCGDDRAAGVYGATQPGDGRPVCVKCAHALKERGWLGVVAPKGENV